MKTFNSCKSSKKKYIDKNENKKAWISTVYRNYVVHTGKGDLYPHQSNVPFLKIPPFYGSANSAPITITITTTLNLLTKLTIKRCHQNNTYYYNIELKTWPEVCNFIKKETLTQVFSCECCEISKNTFFTEHLWTTVSKSFLLFVYTWISLM